MAPLKLTIKIASGATLPVEVEPTLTIKEVKDVVAQASGVPAIQQVRTVGRPHLATLLPCERVHKYL